MSKSNNNQKIEYDSPSSLEEVFETLNRIKLYPLSKPNFESWEYEIQFTGTNLAEVWLFISSDLKKSKIFTKEPKQQEVLQEFYIANIKGTEIRPMNGVYHIKFTNTYGSEKFFTCFAPSHKQAYIIMNLVSEILTVLD